MSSKIQLEQVFFSYGHSFNVINKFQYEFQLGKLYLLLAGNGTGKSTLLKLITKVLLKPKEGKVIHFNRVSYFTETVLLPSMITTKEYLSLTRKLLDYREKSVKQWMNEWNLPKKLIRHCSKGNQQKCAIIALLMQDTDVYLFDEPTNALDADHCKLFCDEIKKLVTKNRMVIVATHDIKQFQGLDYEEIHLS